MESLQGVLDTPATKWRQAAMPVEDDDFDDMEADIEEARPKPDRVFFHVANAKPAKRKLLKGAVGAENVARKHHVALTLHAQLGGDDAPPLVDSKPI
eukprot:7016923-Lingulodinium_polyedra.AAC.1